jgi:hypothetical protein
MKLTKGKIHKILIIQYQTRKNRKLGNTKTIKNVLTYKNYKNYNLKNKTLKNINY